MKEKIFEGAATALYTPFSSDGIDYDALGELIERQIAGKIDAVVILGTTGEAPTVTDKERAEIIKFTVSRVRNRIPVIVGCGSNCTKKFIDYTSLAKDCGADAALGVTPYYNKCSDEGLFRHFRETDKACRFPMIVYNVPSRTGLKVKPTVYEKLAELDSVVGIKEADCDIKHIDETFVLIGEKLPVYCGSDEMNFEFFKRGASGTISVLSNIIPCKIHDYYYDFKNNYRNVGNKADILFEQLSELLFSNVNPIPLKTLVGYYFKKGHILRLPLCEQTAEEKKKLISNFDKILKEINNL